MSIESVMPSNHLILCHPLLLLLTTFPVSGSLPMSWLYQWVWPHQVAKLLEFQLQNPSFQWIFRIDFFRIDYFDLLAVQGTLKSPLNSLEIKPVNQLWIFIGRTYAEASIIWPPDLKNWLIWKDLDAGKDWRQEEKGITEDEMVWWHHRLNEHEFEQTPGDSGGQGSLACCSPRGRRVGHYFVTEGLFGCTRC